MSSASPAEAGGRMAFRPGPWLTACALAGLAVLLALGTWPVQRLHWKAGLSELRRERLAAPPAALPGDVADWRAWDFRRVVADGEFLPEGAQRFGVAAQAGRVGHRLLVPLRRADGAALLVDVGFVPSDAPAAVPVALETPVEGVLRYRGDAGATWLTPDNEPAEGLWYWYDLPGLRAATGLELPPVVLDASPRPAGVDLPNNHLGYAVTWYGLAAALVAFYVALGIRRPDGGEEQGR